MDRSIPGNELFPEVDFLVGKKQLKQIPGKGYQYPWRDSTRRSSGRNQGNGLQIFHKSGYDRISSDMTVPPQKPEMIKQAQDTVD